MKRLTERDEYGNADIIGVESIDLQGNLAFEEFNLVTEAMNKLAAYEDAEERGGWISVEDRLPEVGIKKYLVFIKHEHGDIVDLGRYLGECGWDFGDWEGIKTSRVTHWQPLPVPPIEEGGAS